MTLVSTPDTEVIRGSVHIWFRLFRVSILIKTMVGIEIAAAPNGCTSQTLRWGGAKLQNFSSGAAFQCLPVYGYLCSVGGQVPLANISCVHCYLLCGVVQEYLLASPHEQETFHNKGLRRLNSEEVVMPSGRVLATTNTVRGLSANEHSQVRNPRALRYFRYVRRHCQPYP